MGRLGRRRPLLTLLDGAAGVAAVQQLPGHRKTLVRGFRGWSRRRAAVLQGRDRSNLSGIQASGDPAG